MRRPPELMLFMVFVVATAGAMQASGLAGEMGVQPDTGIEKDVQNSEEELKNRTYSANREKGEVNFIGSVFASVDKVASSFIMVYALYEMLVNAGIPGWLASFASSPVFLMLGMFMIYLISGRRMTVR